jgi:hypothetical protein
MECSVLEEKGGLEMEGKVLEIDSKYMKKHSSLV